MDGLEEAIQTGKELGLQVISGVELNANLTFHILGYGINLGDSPLMELCRRMKANRDERTGRLLAFLKGKGIELTAEEVKPLAGGTIIGRPQFAQAMVRRGYAPPTGRRLTAIWTQRNTIKR